MPLGFPFFYLGFGRVLKPNNNLHAPQSQRPARRIARHPQTLRQESSETHNLLMEANRVL